MPVILDLRLYLQRYLVGKAELQLSKLAGNESETVDRVRNIFEYRRYKRRFREPLQTALGEWTVREGFVLRLLDDQGVTALQGCLAAALAQSEIDRVIVGVDSLKQLEEILACMETLVVIPPETLMTEDLDLINVSRWSTF